LLVAFSEGVFISGSCAGAGAAFHVCMMLLGKDIAKVVVANDKCKVARNWLKGNYECGCLFNDCACWRSSGRCRCSIHDDFCCMPAVREDMFAASAPCVLFSKANNNARVHLIIPTENAAGWPIIEISLHIDDRRPKVYFGEQVADVLTPYKESMATTQAQKDFMAMYSSPWDFFTHGKYNGHPIGLALKIHYHFAWWVGPARNYGSPQCRHRLYYVLVSKAECDVDAFSCMVHVASAALRSTETTTVRELMAYCRAVGAPTILPEASQAGLTFFAGANQVQTHFKPSPDPLQTQSKPSPDPLQTEYKHE
jgi:site-specific DNA-cytosine methylase